MELTTTDSSVKPLDEITRLHSEIIGHARTTLDKAIRIGELLTAEKAKLKHGEWLSWIEEHLPFSHPTAARYMRCFERRDEICHADTFELTDAYRLLAAPGGEKQAVADSRSLLGEALERLGANKPDSQYIPPLGGALFADGACRGLHYTVMIMPYETDGWFYITVLTSSPSGAGMLDFTKKPIHKNAIEWHLDRFLVPSGGLQWRRYDDVPRWKWNEMAYRSQEDFWREEHEQWQEAAHE